MGDAGLFGRELKPPLLQELLDQGTNFIFQHCSFESTGDDEVVRISNEVDLRPDVLSQLPFDPRDAKGLVQQFSSPFKVIFASVGEMMPPCGVPASVGNKVRFSR
jgi:hypothetical protein